MGKINIGLGNGNCEFNISVDKLNNEYTNEEIPHLNINASMLGHKMCEINIRMTPERLIELGNFLIVEGENSKNYYNNKENECGCLSHLR
jgi:hypothetical protein